MLVLLLIAQDTVRKKGEIQFCNLWNELSKWLNEKGSFSLFFILPKIKAKKNLSALIY